MIDYNSRYINGNILNINNTRIIDITSRPKVSINNGITHIVVQGETLESIAYLYYKDATLWWKIADVNNIKNPLFLTPGTAIYIPL